MKNFLLAGMLVLTAGQGCADGSKKACVPNDQKACACLGGGQGIQTCVADGSAFSECAGCTGGSSSGGASSSGSGNSGGTSAPLSSSRGGASSSGGVVTTSSSAPGSSSAGSTSCGTDKFCHPVGALAWSDNPGAMRWDAAGTYCTNLGGRLPTISELRSIIRNCPATESGGACPLTDACLNSGPCLNNSCGMCPTAFDGTHSALGVLDSDIWSASILTDDPLLACTANLTNAHLGWRAIHYANSATDGDLSGVRCVH